MIGGLVLWRSADPLATRDALAAMSGSFRSSPWFASSVAGPVGLLATTPGSRLGTAPGLVVAADLDLTNLDELSRVAGVEADRQDLIAALYTREGLRFVQRLRGGFALALYEPHRKALHLAVDHFGIKRLYYAHDHRRTAFAGRVGTLRHVPAVEGRVDPTAVFNYLNFGFVPAPDSIFAEIRRLPPGHLLTVTGDGLSLTPYWDVTYGERATPLAQGRSELYRLTEEAVARAVAGAPPKEIGAFLSGGTDSSTVVGLATRVTAGPVAAFSIGFQEDPYNELSYAEIAARHFAVPHHTKIVGPAEALDAVDRIVDAYDEPFGNNSAIGTYVCAELARDCGMTRLLAGDGGDEIFGGNERYRVDRVFAAYHRIPRLLRQRLLEPVLAGLPDGGASVIGRAQRYVRRANIANPERFYSWEFYFAREAAELLAPDFLAAIAVDAPHTVTRQLYDRAGATSELNRLLYLDLKLAIGDNDLLKVTRTAELAGIAVRFPLLDVGLVELTATLPARFKVRGLEKRYLFKRAFRELLPPEVLAKRKHGFGVPTSLWLKSDRRFRTLSRDVLLSPRFRQRGYLKPGAVEQLFALHDADATPYFGDTLWKVLMLELWHRRHLDAAPAA